MAMIRMSRDLVHDIKEAARNSFSHRVDTAVNSFTCTVTGDEIYNCIYGSYYNGMKALPREFFSYYNKIEVIRVYDKRFTHTFELSEFKPFPIALADNSIAKKGNSTFYPYHVELLRNAGEWDDLYLSVTTYLDAINAIEKQRQMFLEALNILLSKHTTFGNALKEWPPLWDYVSQDIRDRHNATATRTKRITLPDTSPPVDLGNMTAVATINKISK